MAGLTEGVFGAGVMANPYYADRQRNETERFRHMLEQQGVAGALAAIQGQMAQKKEPTADKRLLLIAKS